MGERLSKEERAELREMVSPSMAPRASRRRPTERQIARLLDDLDDAEAERDRAFDDGVKTAAAIVDERAPAFTRWALEDLAADIRARLRKPGEPTLVDEIETRDRDIAGLEKACASLRAERDRLREQLAGEKAANEGLREELRDAHSELGVIQEQLAVAVRAALKELGEVPDTGGETEGGA